MLEQCPSCFQEIPLDRRMDPVVICSRCGFTQRIADKKWKESLIGFRPFIVTSLLVSALMLSFFYLQSLWGSQVFEVLPGYTRHLLGQANSSDYKLMSQISLRLHRGEESLIYLKKHVALSPNDSEALHELAFRLYKMNRFQESAPIYYRYLQTGGQDTLAHFHYAKILSQLNQVDQATQIFESILKSKPDTFQITVATAYVHHLIEHGKTQEAIHAIRSIQKLGTNTSSFMSESLKKLRKG